MFAIAGISLYWGSCVDFLFHSFYCVSLAGLGLGLGLGLTLMFNYQLFPLARFLWY